MSDSSFFPSRIVAWSFWKTFFGSLSRIWRAPNVLTPKYCDVGVGPLPLSPFRRARAGGRTVMSRIAALRDEAGAMAIGGDSGATVGGRERRTGRDAHVGRLVTFTQPCTICNSVCTQRPNPPHVAANCHIGRA